MIKLMYSIVKSISSKIRKIKNGIFQSSNVIQEEQSKRIGKDTSILDSNLANYVALGSNCYIFNSTIGEYTYMSSFVTIMNSKIGKFCSIAQGVGISLGLHPSKVFVSTSPMFFSTKQQCGTTFSDGEYFREMGSCNIGNDVWIGANAIIKDDISIGDGAIIGAGAIVTKDVLPYAIVVGNPARVIRFRFKQEEIDFLLKFKWWDKEPDWLKENFKHLHNIENFMKIYAD